MVNFPNAPISGERHTENGTTWVWTSPPDVWKVESQGNLVEIVEDVITDGFGWQVVGDKLIQWGSDTTPSGGTLRITFSQAFESTPRVTAVPRFTGAINNAASINTYDPTVTQVSVQTTLITNGGAVSDIGAVFDWIAIGEAPDALKKPKQLGSLGSDQGGKVVLLDSGTLYDATGWVNQIDGSFASTAGPTLAPLRLGSGEFIKGTLTANIRNENRNTNGTTYTGSVGHAAHVQWFNGTAFEQDSTTSLFVQDILTRQSTTGTVTLDASVTLPFQFDESHLRPDTNEWRFNLRFYPVYNPGNTFVRTIRYDWNHYRRIA